jgi:predicted nuclease of restriction endonuclease-like (RecB) superfamily
LIPELARRLNDAGCIGLGASNLKNCRQISLTWPGLEIRQTLSGVFGALSEARIRRTTSAESPTPAGEEPIRQTASGECDGGYGVALEVLSRGDLSFPSLTQRATSAKRLRWQDQTWLERLFSSLSFSKLLQLSRIEDTQKRAFYELECLRSGWSVRELQRQIDSMLYERVGLSKDKTAVLAMAENGTLVDTPATVIRDPHVLEFLGLERKTAWSESDLEQVLIDHLQQFVHELGSDYCFVDRQYRITVGSRHHFIDLLFFHRRLRCLIAMDLKLGTFQHEDAGQMNFYLTYLADNVALPGESPPVGLVLCANKDAAEVHYSTAGLEHSIFVSRYLVQLPSESELTRWLEEERAVIAGQLRLRRAGARAGAARC